MNPAEPIRNRDHVTNLRRVFAHVAVVLDRVEYSEVERFCVVLTQQSVIG